jgi:hypothetical protein
MALRRMQARYPGKCWGCNGAISPGDPILWGRDDGTFHAACHDDGSGQAAGPGPSEDNGELQAERRVIAAEEREYQAGIADGERYSSDRKIYGEELADQWEIDRELRDGDY